MKSILVPIDFSPVSRLVVSRAAALAQPAKATLVILHVVQPPAVLADYDPALPVVQTMSRAAVRQLSKWKGFAEAHGLTATTVCRSGVSPSQVIAAEADRHGSDYVVIGSHGHGAIYDLLVGSTTGGVLRRVHCPVVIVPATQRASVRSAAARELIHPEAPLCNPNPIVPIQSGAGARVRTSIPLLGAEKAAHPFPNYAN